MMRWGLLIPPWAKKISGVAGMINARSETAATKPAFRDLMKFRRCLVPADGSYEWVRAGKAKQPYGFEINNGRVVRIRGVMGWLARPERAMDEIVFEPDHHSERGDISRP